MKAKRVESGRFDQAVAEEQGMMLTGADRKAFLDAILKPPVSTERRVAALRRHREPVTVVGGRRHEGAIPE